MCLRCGVWQFWHAWVAATVQIRPQHFSVWCVWDVVYGSFGMLELRPLFRLDRSTVLNTSPTLQSNNASNMVQKGSHGSKWQSMTVWQGNNGRRRILKRLRPSFCEPCWHHGQALWRHLFDLNGTFWFDYCLNMPKYCIFMCQYNLIAAFHCLAFMDSKMTASAGSTLAQPHSDRSEKTLCKSQLGDSGWAEARGLVLILYYAVYEHVLGASLSNGIKMVKWFVQKSCIFSQVWFG